MTVILGSNTVPCSEVLKPDAALDLVFLLFSVFSPIFSSLSDYSGAAK